MLSVVVVPPTGGRAVGGDATRQEHPVETTGESTTGVSVESVVGAFGRSS